MNENEISYDKICEQWDDNRKRSKINNCIVDFAGLLEPDSRVPENILPRMIQFNDCKACA